jgi:tight adherence protein B
VTLNLLLLGRVAFLLGLIAALVVYHEYFGFFDSTGRVRFREYERSLEEQLRFVRATFSGRELVVAQIALSLVLGIGILAFRSWILLSLLPIVFAGPKVFLSQKATQRVTRIESQVEAWLNAIANSLKASPSLGEAIASTISLVPAPMSEEVSVLVKEHEFGTALDVALENFAARIGSKTVEGTILALKIARNSGGNLPETLENASAALRELARLEGVVRTKTAEGKAQAFVIGAVPFPLVAGLHSMDPNYFKPLTERFVGNIALGGAALLWAAAILGARKILSVDV